jgi:hypothetical protein
MKAVAAILGLGALGAGLGLAGCGAPPASGSAPPASAAPVQASSVASAAASTVAPTSRARSAAPVTTKTVTRVATVAAGAPTTGAAPASSPPAATAQPPAGPDVTDPWAVVSAYYGNIDSGDYAQAYALIGDGTTTGQSYQQFAAGFSCTGSQQVSENWESGDQVNFDLAATDSCTGSTDFYTGTDTVESGTIVSADIQQTG